MTYCVTFSLSPKPGFLRNTVSASLPLGLSGYDAQPSDPAGLLFPYPSSGHCLPHPQPELP